MLEGKRVWRPRLDRKRVWRPKCGEWESGDLAGRARVPCEKVNNGSGQNLSWKLCVKEKWVRQESRTLDQEWRDSAGRARKENNGFRRPYIRPQSAGSWISRSRGVKPSRSVKIPKWTVSQPNKLQGSYNKSSRRKSSAVEAYIEQDRYVETFGIGVPGISELRRR